MKSTFLGKESTSPVKQKQMKSKQYPYEVYVLRKRVNPSSESSQLISDETVNQIRTGRQMLKNMA